jgi:hypothetical protein
MSLATGRFQSACSSHAGHQTNLMVNQQHDAVFGCGFVVTNAAC